ncbi:Cthe_2314 family HEPN domain-containing protein [Brevibacillus sp. HD1.4A]|uniref:Cthe_2314 family HEPN domain-containing protein n=1 Tax=Brevibacillus sp. HD1.4A TaxID=2738978 RepID=UPI00156B8526|nr:Cthe_2314 family HEPN domain-containing protein [Brevibacillus sp. HD1.4A]NRQ56062.1 hypothetical protein [Brevibacillus sp. HD1.4A]
MEIITLEIETLYIEKARKELNIPQFPNTENIIQKLYGAIGTTKEESNKFMRMITWIRLLEKKYVEAYTSVVYGLAHHFKSEEHGLYSHSEPFYQSQVSYFTDTATSRAFSLAEKLAQLINVYQDLGLKEAGMGKGVVSFKNVSSKVSFNLVDLDNALIELDQDRHAHVHRLDPEIVRSEIKEVSNGLVGGKPSTLIFTGIDETKLPVVPYQQLMKCKNVLIAFCVSISQVLSAIDQEL